MPGHKRQRTSGGSLRRTRTINPYRRPRNALVSVPRNKIGFPQQMRTKLRYSTRIEFIPTGTSVLSKTFLANGMYDPDVSLGGHQPRGFDEFMKTYQTFTVKGSRVSCTFMYEGYNGPTKVSTTGNLIQSITDGMTDQTAAASPVVCGMQKSTSLGHSDRTGGSNCGATDGRPALCLSGACGTTCRHAWMRG
jgi:hypothetical protein